MKTLKSISFSSSAFLRSIHLNGVRRSSLSSLLCSFHQKRERDVIGLIGMHIRSLSSVALHLQIPTWKALPLSSLNFIWSSSSLDTDLQSKCQVIILRASSTKSSSVSSPSSDFNHGFSIELMSEYDVQTNDDGKVMEKEAALRLALSQLSSEFGRESMLTLQRFFGSRRTPIVSTGSLRLDLALGTGGLPKGRMVEIYGREASGKTTLALHIIKEAQKLGGYCAYLDVENAFDPSLAESIGVNTENLLISQMDSAESSLSVVDTLVKSGSVDVIVVDSVAALVPQCELDSVIDSNIPQVQSRLMTKALRKISSSLCRSQTLLIFTNQVRSNLRSSNGFGHLDEVTCGGNALKFYAAVRMRMSTSGLLRNENEVTGLSVSVQVVKNKLAPAMKKAELEIMFGRGFICEAEVLEMACMHGVIFKMGNSYVIEGEVLKDKKESEKYLTENHDVVEKLVAIVRNRLFET